MAALITRPSWLGRLTAAPVGGVISLNREVGIERMKTCTTCNVNCEVGILKGNGWIELVLWLCYIIPGLIYSIWRRTGEPTVCPTCKNETLIPFYESEKTQPTIERIEVDCEWCAEKILANAKICKHCGKEVTPQEIAVATPEVKKMFSLPRQKKLNLSLKHPQLHG